MRFRKTRRLLTLASLLLSVAVIALWARSLFVADWLSHSRAAADAGSRYARAQWIVISGHGFIGITKAKWVPVDDASADWLQELDREPGWVFQPLEGYRPSWGGFAHGLRRFGYASGVEDRVGTPRHWKSFEIPDWLLLLVVSLPAQVALVRWAKAARTRRKARPGGFPVAGGLIE